METILLNNAVLQDLKGAKKRLNLSYTWNDGNNYRHSIEGMVYDWGAYGFEYDVEAEWVETGNDDPRTQGSFLKSFEITLQNIYDLDGYEVLELLSEETKAEIIVELKKKYNATFDNY